MIKFLLMPSLILNILYGDILYRFPDNRTAWLHDLSHQLKNAQNITIISTIYNDSQFSKKLIKSAQKGSKIRLILQNPSGEPQSLIQYENIDLYTTNKIPKHSSILFDQKLVCISATPLNDQLIGSKLHCSDNPHVIMDQLMLIRNLIKKSDPYLQ